MGNIRGGMNGFLGTIGQPTAQVIDGSLKFNGSNQSLERVFSSGGNRRTFTLSYWIKEHGKGSSPTNNPHILWSGTSVETRGGMVHRGTGSGDAGRIYMFNQVSNSTNSAVWTNSMHRDFSGWKHVVFKVDSTQGTGTNRVKIYINGVEQDDEYKTTPAQNLEFQINVAQEHRIGRGIPDDYGNFSLSQYYFIDGQALGPEYFAFTDPLTNTWRPKKYTGTYGTTGFWLPMDNEDNFEKDRSGNGNHWTKSNFSSGTYGTFNNPNVLKDSPSGAVFGGRAQTGITTTSSAPANYCTWNPLSGQYIDLQDGNLDAESGTISSYATIPSTMAMTNGKYYAEFTYRENINGAGDGSNFFRFGISQTDRDFESGSDPLGTSKDFGWQGAGTLTARTNGSNSYTYTGNTIADGDILSLAFDADAGKLWIARNGTWATNSGGAGDPANGNNPDYSSLNYSGGYFFVAGPYAGAASPADGGGRLSAGLVGNWGQKPFKYVPPKGFLPLNSATARPNTVVPRSDQYVGVTTYNGNNTAGHKINVGFDPDFVIFGRRTNTAEHFTYDTVRGAGYAIKTSSDGQQEDQTGSLNFLKAFVDDGFTLGTDQDVNSSSDAYVTWNWKAGGSKNTFNVDDVGYASAAAAGLTGGDITPTGASVGTKQGFSIIKYAGSGTSGDTLPHGLSQTPDLIITKCLDASSIDWIVKPVGLLSSESHMLILNGNNAEFQGTGGHISAQTSTTVTLTEGSNDGNYNNSGDNYIMYSWHNVPGLQKFGKYTGNNSSDGPYVELGFRPAIVWIKGLDFAANWFIFDNQREFDFNPTDEWFNLDTSSSANAGGGIGGGTAVPIDFLSNGFKVRFGTAGYINNTSSYNFVYCAWAEAPASNLFGGQSNAR